MKLFFKRQARAELKRAVKYYNDEKPGLGNDFLDRTEESLTVILEGPNRFGVIYADVHCYPQIERFPYSIYYRVVHERRVEIVAIGHHKREPGYWHSRLE
jgi:plasmid stabilization system protein ParE